MWHSKDKFALGDSFSLMIKRLYLTFSDHPSREFQVSNIPAGSKYIYMISHLNSFLFLQ